MVTTASADGAVIMVNHIDGVLRSTGARVRPFPPLLSPLFLLNILLMRDRQSRWIGCTKWSIMGLSIRIASRMIFCPRRSCLMSCSMGASAAAEKVKAVGAREEGKKTTPKSAHGPPKSVSTAVRGTMPGGWVKLGGWRVGVRVGLGGSSGCRVFGGLRRRRASNSEKAGRCNHVILRTRVIKA